jgi:putative ATPase
MHKAIASIEGKPKTSVPLHLRNAPTKLMKNLGYGNEYQYPHDTDIGHVADVHYLPDELRGEKFYQPSEHGAEKAIKERLSKWKADR